MNAAEVEARRWFKQAQADLIVVQTLKSAGHFAAACFHSQQAAEKALKAVLYSQGKRVVLGHSVQELGRQSQNYNSMFTALLTDAALLDQFYIPTRYPNGLPSPDIPAETYPITQAESAATAAERVLNTVETFLRTNTQVLS